MFDEYKTKLLAIVSELEEKADTVYSRKNRKLEASILGAMSVDKIEELIIERHSLKTQYGNAKRFISVLEDIANGKWPDRDFVHTMASACEFIETMEEIGAE